MGHTYGSAALNGAGLKASVAHVLWIGGAADAGKTSVAQALAAAHGWRAYRYDRLKDGSQAMLKLAEAKARGSDLVLPRYETAGKA